MVTSLFSLEKYTFMRQQDLVLLLRLKREHFDLYNNEKEDFGPPFCKFKPLYIPQKVLFHL